MSYINMYNAIAFYFFVKNYIILLTYFEHIAD